MPKDFSGKNKTSKTYDKDWVFHNGAWVTKRQRKSSIADQKEAKAYRTNLTAAATSTTPVPGVPPVTGVAPIEGVGKLPVADPFAKGQAAGGVQGTTMPPIPGQTGPDTSVPSWWIGNAITNPSTPEDQFANMANALLPTLAPEDQRTLATYLATKHKDVYGGYANTQFGEAPTEITDDVRKKFLSPQRAQLAISLLDKMKAASGATDMGGGYDFLKNAINLINQFAVDGVMTREKYGQFTNAVSNLTKNATGDLSAYGNLAQLFNLPQFTAGPLVSNTPNAKLFG